MNSYTIADSTPYVEAQTNPALSATQPIMYYTEQPGHGHNMFWQQSSHNVDAFGSPVAGLQLWAPTYDFAPP